MFQTLEASVFLIKILILTAFADTESDWYLGNKKYIIYYDHEIQTMLSSDCKTKTCQAKTFISNDKKQAQSPSERCEQLKGRVLILRNARQSENAFCEAPDHSLINLSILIAF